MILSWILARLREPSTHTAIAGFLGAIGITASGSIIGQVLLGLAALFGLFGIGVGERKAAAGSNSSGSTP